LKGTAKETANVRRALRADPSDTATLAEAHISGSGDDAPGISFAENAHFAAMWALNKAKDDNVGKAANDATRSKAYLVLIDPNRTENNGTTYRGTNLEEGNEVTFIFEAHYQEAVLYEVVPKVAGKQPVYDKATG